MRQTCPNCGAEYDIPEGMLPSEGRHVQCSACHTRWFVRGSVGPATSEEQILTRLESWRPRPVPAPTPVVPSPADAPRPRLVEPLRVVTAAGPAEEAAVPAPPRQREVPTKPAQHPTVARPAPLQPAVLQPVPPPPLRPAPRLDLGAEREAPAPAAVQAPRSRFLSGFLLVAALAAAAFGTYRFRDPIAASVPAARPALATYAETVDGWRAELERLIAPYRSGART